MIPLSKMLKKDNAETKPTAMDSAKDVGDKDKCGAKDPNNCRHHHTGKFAKGANGGKKGGKKRDYSAEKKMSHAEWMKVEQDRMRKTLAATAIMSDDAVLERQIEWADAVDTSKQTPVQKMLAKLAKEISQGELAYRAGKKPLGVNYKNGAEAHEGDIVRCIGSLGLYRVNKKNEDGTLELGDAVAPEKNVGGCGVEFMRLADNREMRQYPDVIEKEMSRRMAFFKQFATDEAIDPSPESCESAKVAKYMVYADVFSPMLNERCVCEPPAAGPDTAKDEPATPTLKKIEEIIGMLARETDDKNKAKRIRVAFIEATPAHLEEGCYADTGWEDENGQEFASTWEAAKWMVENRGATPLDGSHEFFFSNANESEFQKNADGEFMPKRLYQMYPVNFTGDEIKDINRRIAAKDFNVPSSVMDEALKAMGCACDVAPKKQQTLQEHLKQYHGGKMPEGKCKFLKQYEQEHPEEFKAAEQEVAVEGADKNKKSDNGGASKTDNGGNGEAKNAAQEYTNAVAKENGNANSGENANANANGGKADGDGDDGHGGHALTDTDAPAIYIGTYGNYNNGSLEGAGEASGWIDLSTFSDADEFQEWLHEQDPNGDHEFMFQDFQGFPQELYSETSCPQDIWDYMDFRKNTSIPEEAIDDCISEVGDFQELKKAEEEGRVRIYDDCWTFADVAQSIIAEQGEDAFSDGEYESAFDFESFGRDLASDEPPEGSESWYESYGVSENDNDSLARAYVESLGSVTDLGMETVKRYCDFNKLGRDLQYSGSWVRTNGPKSSRVMVEIAD